MASPTERNLKRELDALQAQADPTGGPSDIQVEWQDAAPADRPDGITWTPGTEDEPTRVAYDLWRAQRECLNALDGETDLVAFLAGYGSGKSVFGARWLLTQALTYPGSRFLAMGVDFQKARSTTYRKLFDQLPGERTDLTTSGFNGPENSPIVADYNRQSHQLTLTNDSVITLGSADKYSRYAGAEFGAIWMDEPSHYGDELHDLTGMMTARLRAVDGPKTMLWTLTGEGYNAAWEVLEQRQDGDGEPIGLDIEVVRASVLENPYLPEGDKARLRRKYEGTSKEQQALHGGFAAASGLVYSNFSRDTHVIPVAEARERVTDDWRIYGYDAGWNNPRVLLEIGRTAYDQLVVLDEFYQSNTHVDDAIRWLQGHSKPDGVVFAEHEPADVKKFQRAGWRVQRAEKSINPGIAEVRRRLEPDGNRAVSQEQDIPSVCHDSSHSNSPPDDALDVDHQSRVGFLMADSCEHLIREFHGYKEEQVGSGTATDHALDALRYAVMGASGGRERSRNRDRQFVRTF